MNKPRKQRIWPLARRRAEAAMARYEEIVRANREDPLDPSKWDTFAAVGWDTTGEAAWEPGDIFYQEYGRPPTDAEQLVMDPLFDALQEKLKGEWAASHGLTLDEDIEPCHPCKDAGEVGAWAMILAARSRGWIVSDPEPNGMGYYHVTVWAKGPDDAALTPYGTPTEA